MGSLESNWYLNSYFWNGTLCMAILDKNPFFIPEMIPGQYLYSTNIMTER